MIKINFINLYHLIICARLYFTKRICRLIHIYLVLLLPSVAMADFRALLIGIDYENRAENSIIHSLCGATNDVNDVYRLMTKRLGIPEHKIKRLTEAEATKQNILDTFQDWFIKGTKAGDQLFFMYSGHGVLVPDLTKTQYNDPQKIKASSKDKQLSEAFVPYDAIVNVKKQQVKNLILDTEFHPLLKQLADRDLTLFIDSCYSGGITRDIGLHAASTRRVDLPWVEQSELPINPLFSGMTRGVYPQTWQPAYQLFAAAQYNQQAYEYFPLNCGSNGAMTYAFLQLLNHHSEKYSNQQILDFTRHYLKEEIGLGTAIQLPQFVGPVHSENARFVLFQQSDNLFKETKSKSAVKLDLWIDQPSKQHFVKGQEITIYYKISGLKPKKTVWFSLFNINSAGKLSMIYPQPKSFYDGSGTHHFLNAKIDKNKIYQIPYTKLTKNENISTDMQYILNNLGRETFYAMITDKKLTWQDLDITPSWRNEFTDKDIRKFIRKTHALVQKNALSAEKSIQIMVHPH